MAGQTIYLYCILTSNLIS